MDTEIQVVPRETATDPRPLIVLGARSVGSPIVVVQISVASCWMLIRTPSAVA